MSGQRAWAHIKATAAEQRVSWRLIGEALRYGRSLHKADRAFAQWVQENGFGDMDRKSRTDAMWLAENWAEVGNDSSLTHPVAIRASHREAQADTPPAPELTIEAPARLTASIEQVAPQAHRINKLASMAERVVPVRPIQHWTNWNTDMTALVTRTYPANGHTLTFRGDGWFNMTTAAQAFGKHLHNFWTSPETAQYLAAVEETMKSMVARGGLYTAQRGHGTWAHPKLAVFFARWLDVKFAVWCDMQIDELIRGCKTDPFKGPTELPVKPRLVRVPVR